MSFDELFVANLLRALAIAKLEAIVVGSGAGALQGAPVTTQDIDILIRETPLNRRKLKSLCAELGVHATRPSDLADVIKLVGLDITVDVLFGHISGNLRFESLKSRAVRVPVGDQVAVCACLEDIIASKQAANRPKDLIQLPTLRDALRVKHALAELKAKGEL